VGEGLRGIENYFSQNVESQRRMVQLNERENKKEKK
jgi:hypothetical protein